MTLPIDVILVRHGESEGNVASKLSRKGDDRLFSAEFRNRHSSRLRLSPKGREQAKAAGEWLKANFPGHNFFGRYVTSEYVRAMETAARLGLPNAKWYVDYYLRERDWGEMEILPESERREKFSDAIRLKDVEPFYWKPPNGQSIAEKCLEVDRALDTWHRDALSDKPLVCVAHGETMWCMRIRLERMNQDRYRELDLSKHPHNRIHNCQIIHYSRRSPETGNVGPYPNWVRSICPWDTTMSSNEWEPIIRQNYSNEELLARVMTNRTFIE